MYKIIRYLTNKIGFDLIKKQTQTISTDIQQDNLFLEIYNKCAPYTMTSPERMYALYKAVIYVIKNNIQGDFVECGVWKGGSAMLIAHTLLAYNITTPTIYMYDTFEGMSEPTEKDKDYKGTNADILLEKNKDEKEYSVWCYSNIEEVQKNLAQTQYPTAKLNFIKGKVEETIPNTIPHKIALLRLDTDWYESTHHELVYLYPLLQTNGVLILDDYGHWAGAKEAVDIYFKEHNKNLLLNRIDYTARIAIKL